MSETLQLSKKPSPDILNLLIRAKLMLEHSLSHSSQPSGIDPLLAIHGFDNVIEYLLRIIADHIDYEAITGKAFPVSELSSMAGELSKLLKNETDKPLPYFAEIKNLRQVRNLVQHGCVNPGSDLGRYANITIRFFKKISLLFFGTRFDELTISELVVNHTVKSILKAAEITLEDGSCVDSISLCRDAFDHALLERRYEMQGRIDPTAAISELPENHVYTEYFFKNISESIEYLKLGLNPVSFDRYQEITDHLPLSHRSDKSCLVLQREWTRDDAQYCYSFVSNNIVRWQFEELEPLYERATFDGAVSFEESINGIVISNQYKKGGCTYSGVKPTIIVRVINGNTKEQLDSLEVGQEYQNTDIRRRHGKLEHKLERKIRIVHKRFNILTHNPPLWELVLSYEIVPFTWRFRKFEDGKLVSDSPRINRSSVSKLTSLYGVSKALASKVVEYRRSVKQIQSVSDLKNIEGITPNEVESLSRYVRL